MASTIESIRNSYRRLQGRAQTPENMAPLAPFGSPFWGHLPRSDAHGSILDLLARAHATTGQDLLRFEFPFITAHSMRHPDDLERVLVSEAKDYSKETRGYQVMRRLLGNGLLTSDGDFWLRQRRIAQPAFHRKRLDRFASIMQEESDKLVHALLAKPSAYDLCEPLSAFTLAVMGRTLLSTDTSKDADVIFHSVDVILREAMESITNPLRRPLFLPNFMLHGFSQAAATLDAIVYRIIDERRRGLQSAEQQPDDLLQMLVEARDEDTGESMDDKQLRDEVMTMFLAGHETTAMNLAWTLHGLAQHPRVLADVRDEVDGLGSAPSTEQMLALPLLKRVIAESLRLYPPAWIVGRAPKKDVVFRGATLQSTTRVFISPWIVHRHPEFWVDAEAFDPDRFLPERAKTMHKCQYIPFLVGPRMCIGAGFAQMEAQIALATLLRAIEFVPAYTALEADPLITLRPKGGLRMQVRARTRS